ncbi:hypothetical protein RBA39_22775, partial [Mycobacteroides abscessus subsp. massiliense]
YRAGVADWTFVDSSACGASAVTPDRLAEVLTAPAVPAIALCGPTATAAHEGQESVPMPKESASANSSFNQRPTLATEYCAPRSELEERIAAIWRRFFGYDRIGV